jgi:hypothetical protein
MPNSLLYSVCCSACLLSHACAALRAVDIAQVLLCASVCGMSDLCSECEYLLCLRIYATAFKDKSFKVPVDDDSTTFELIFGTVPKSL